MTIPVKTDFYFLTLLIISFLGCKSEPSEIEEYQIISEVLNHSYGHPTDDENGLGWVDLSKDYNALFVIKHTNQIPSDIEKVYQYLKLNNYCEFSIDELKKYREWDIARIIGYDRYQLESEGYKKADSHYIGQIQFSSISFNKGFDRAIIYTSYMCGGECGQGLLFHLSKSNKWEIEKVEVMWVS